MKTLNLVIVAAALLLTFSSSHASLGLTQHYLKGEPATGTRIKPVEASSNIPFNKSYEELSKQHQDLVKAKFNNLGIDDVPPFPSKGLKSVYKPVINAHKKFSTTGDLRIVVDVASNGVVNKVAVQDSDNDALNNYLERKLSRVAFEPARCNGVKCDMQFPIEISFN